MKKAKTYLFIAYYSQGVGHCHSHFSRGSEVSRGMEKLYCGKGKASGVPGLEAVGMGKP